MATSADRAEFGDADDTYADEVEVLRQGFAYELCHECGGDLGDHVIAPDMFGHPHAWCRTEGTLF